MAATENAENAPADARKAELEALFQQWEQSGPEFEAAPAATTNPGVIKRRLITTVILMAITAYVMVSTGSSVAYWLQPATPQPLGDLRARWVAGERSLEASDNTHVAMSGLIPSRLLAVTTEADGKEVADAAVEYVFFCPLFNITVLTSQPIHIPALRMPEIAADMTEVVRNGLAFPADTLVRFEGAGRLLRGDDAPPSLRRFVANYAKRVDLEVADTWVLVDGHTPSEETAGVIVWGLAALPSLISLFFLARAFRRRSRAA